MICRECKSSENEFKAHKSHKNTGICKPCHNAYTRQYHRKQKAKMSPGKVFQCDDCDLMFGVKNMSGKMNTCCIYCQSENIQTVAEQQGKAS